MDQPKNNILIPSPDEQHKPLPQETQLHQRRIRFYAIILLAFVVLALVAVAMIVLLVPKPAVDVQAPAYGFWLRPPLVG